MKKISIIIPCFNEEKSLPYLYNQLYIVLEQESKYDWQILFIDDGSKDSTLGILKSFVEEDRRVGYIELSRNFGKENAMLAGFDYAEGDCAILMDADLQDPPELIHQMLNYWEEGYEDVYAKRRTRGKESWLRKKLTMLFYSILYNSTRYDILRNVGDYRLLDRKCIDALKSLRENDRYTKGFFCWIGFKKKEILFDRNDRIAGQSNWGYISLFNLAINGITSFTTFPLRLATIAGLITAICALCYMVWIILKAFIWGDPVAGFPTIMSVMLFFGAIQLISIGVLGEYVGRIFTETKGRPVYIVREYRDGKSNEIDHKYYDVSAKEICPQNVTTV